MALPPQPGNAYPNVIRNQSSGQTLRTGPPSVRSISSAAPVVKAASSAPVVKAASSAPVVKAASSAPVVKAASSAPVVKTLPQQPRRASLHDSSRQQKGANMTSIPEDTVIIQPARTAPAVVQPRSVRQVGIEPSKKVVNSTGATPQKWLANGEEFKRHVDESLKLCARSRTPVDGRELVAELADVQRMQDDLARRLQIPANSFGNIDRKLFDRFDFSRDDHLRATEVYKLFKWQLYGHLQQTNTRPQNVQTVQSLEEAGYTIIDESPEAADEVPDRAVSQSLREDRNRTESITSVPSELCETDEVMRLKQKVQQLELDNEKLQKELGGVIEPIARLAMSRSDEQKRYIQCFTKKSILDMGTLVDLQDEFETMKRLEFERIAPCLEIFLDTANVYVINYAYRGCDFRNLKRNAMEKKQVDELSETWWRKVFGQCFDALDFMHSQAMMHCDIKEPNWMMKTPSYEDPEVMLLDYGISKVLTSRDTRMVIGTPGYMPPETMDTGWWYPTGDVFSMGVVIFQMLTDNVPDESLAMQGNPLAGLFIQGCHDLFDVKGAVQTRKPNFDQMPHTMPFLIELTTRLLDKDRNSRPNGHAVKQAEATSNITMVAPPIVTKAAHAAPANAAPTGHAPVPQVNFAAKAPICSGSGTSAQTIKRLLDNTKELKTLLVTSFKKAAGSGGKSLDIHGFQLFKVDFCQKAGLPEQIFATIDGEYSRFDFEGSGSLAANEVYKLIKWHFYEYLLETNDIPKQGVRTLSVSAAGYTVMKDLGGGSIANIKVAVDQHGNQRCLKCFQKSEIHAFALTSIQDEYETMKLLACKNIARSFDLFQDNSFVYLVCELYHGGDFTTLKQNAMLKNGGLSEDWWKKVFRQCFEALGFMHQQAMMHCDIKEPNLMLRTTNYAEPQVVLIDFGVAQLMTARDTGMVSGTPGYMPPETMNNGKWYPSGDVFSMGVVIYQILTDQIPNEAAAKAGAPLTGLFLQGCSSLEDVKYAVNVRQPDFRVMPPNMPGIKSLTMRTLDKNLGSRPKAPIALKDPWFGDMPSASVETSMKAHHPLATTGISDEMLSKLE